MNSQIYKLCNNDTDVNLLFNYLLEVNNEFEIPLTDKIADLKAYALKLIELANVFMIVSDNVPMSLIAYYTNNTIDNIAYLPILSTKKYARGKKYAQILIQTMIQDCSQKKIKSIKCDSINPIAIALYKRLGFIEYKKEINNNIEKIYLEYRI